MLLFFSCVEKFHVFENFQHYATLFFHHILFWLLLILWTVIFTLFVYLLFVCRCLSTSYIIKRRTCIVRNKVYTRKILYIEVVVLKKIIQLSGAENNVSSEKDEILRIFYCLHEISKIR